MKVYLNFYGIWSEILDEDECFIVAKGPDVVMTYIIKDGTENVRQSA